MNRKRFHDHEKSHFIPFSRKREKTGGAPKWRALPYSIPQKRLSKDYGAGLEIILSLIFSKKPQPTSGSRSTFYPEKLDDYLPLILFTSNPWAVLQIDGAIRVQRLADTEFTARILRLPSKGIY